MPFECKPVPTDKAEELLPILLAAEEGEERVRSVLLDPTCTAYAARADGELVGAAVVRWEPGEASEIIYIAVLHERRGQGYGKRMLASLQDELHARGGAALLVGTASASLENLAFYQKCGFRVFEIRRDYFAYIQPPLWENGIQLRDMVVLRYEVEETKYSPYSTQRGEKREYGEMGGN